MNLLDMTATELAKAIKEGRTTAIAAAEEVVKQIELKEKESEVYWHTVHVAYLSDKLATALNLDGQCVKTMAYYYKIGLLHGEATYENTLLAIEDYDG